MTRLRGTFTALVTPFKPDGSLDLDGLRRLVDIQLKAGVSGLVPLGSTGEAATCETEEYEEVIRTVVKVVNGKVPVIVGTGSNSTKHAIETTKRAKACGADVALLVTPYYVKPTNEGIYRHFKAVAEEGGLPILVYNIASRTARNIDVPTLERIAELPGVIGVKEGSGDINQMMEVIQRLGRVKPHFTVLSGDDALTCALLALGGDGVISVASNLVPQKMVEMVKAGLAGDIEQARIKHYDLLPLFRALFIETNPIPVKEALVKMGLPAGPCRLPLCEMEPAHREALYKVLASMNL
jgi:4-hydroxy-tetrahydrodipicolinate synthase